MAKDKSQPFVGIDLGGTNIQCGVLASGSDSKLLNRAGTKTKAETGSDAVLDRIAKLVHKVCDAAGVDVKDLGGIGIGAPGAVDIEKGLVLNAVNLGWVDLPVEKLLSKRLDGVPVKLDNDVNVGAWGEYKAGAGKGFDTQMAVFVGTGIGGGLILDGKLYHGPGGTAGEIGHIVLQSGGTLGRRTLENLASRTSIVNTLINQIESNQPSIVPELVDGDLSRIRSKILAQATTKKDPLTLRVISDAARIVGIGIANVVTLLSIRCVVVGGGATEALGEPWMDLIRQSFREHVFPAELRDCRIVASKLEDDAGVVGAALLARERLTA